MDRTGAGVLECWDLRFCFSPKGAGRGGQGGHFWWKCMGTRKVCMARSIARWLASGWQQAPAYAEASESRDGRKSMPGSRFSFAERRQEVGRPAGRQDVNMANGKSQIPYESGRRFSFPEYGGRSAGRQVGTGQCRMAIAHANCYVAKASRKYPFPGVPPIQRLRGRIPRGRN